MKFHILRSATDFSNIFAVKAENALLPIHFITCTLN